jgi:hypothetical protein
MEAARNQPDFSKAERIRILRRVHKAELFERFLHTKYVGQKRFSLEGGETMVAAVDSIIEHCPDPRRRGGRHGHGPPRPPQHPHQRHAEELRRALRAVLGKLHPRDRRRRRRREIPPRLRGHPRDRRRPQGRGPPRRQPSHLEIVNPVVEGKARARQRMRGAIDQRWRVLPAPDPRRRRLCRPGHRGRDAQLLPAARLQDRRHAPHRRQQPDRLHHRAARLALHPLLHRRRQDDRGADLPRERRRPRGRLPRRPPRPRIPRQVPARRRHRHGLLPQARPQRDRRARLHPAAPLPEDRHPPADLRGPHPQARRRGHHHRAGIRGHPRRVFRGPRERTSRRPRPRNRQDRQARRRRRGPEVRGLHRRSSSPTSTSSPCRPACPRTARPRRPRPHHAARGLQAQPEDQALPRRPRQGAPRRRPDRLGLRRGPRLRHPRPRAHPRSASAARTASAAPSATATPSSTTWRPAPPTRR